MNSKLKIINNTLYIQNTTQTKLLSHNEEYILAKKLKDNNDLYAAKTLIEAHLNYVIKIAKNYKGYGLILTDLIQEGTIGLMKAVKRFDPERGIRLISFAIHWIRAEIHEYIIKNIRIVKIATTKDQRKLFFNFKKNKKINWLNNNDIEIMSNKLNVKKKEIKYMEKRLTSKDIPFNIISYNTCSIEKNSLSIPENYVKSSNKNPLVTIEENNWNIYILNKLKISLNKLDYRSQYIIKNRWLSRNKLTLKNLAHIYNISSERIRQLEKKAIKKLKNITK